MAGKMTLAEIEDRAKRVIRSACPAEMMEIECLTTDRETGRVFIVLKCLTIKNPDQSNQSLQTQKSISLLQEFYISTQCQVLRFLILSIVVGWTLCCLANDAARPC